MRRMFYSAAAVMVAGAALYAGPPQAQARDYPWCAYYGGGMEGARNCGFVSFRQCQEDVSGIGGYCDRNPYYVAAERHRSRHDDQRYR